MTEITRETLELAALAIGGTRSPGNEKVRVGETWGNWEWRGPLGIEVAGAIMHPHLDDGDAFRLAVAVGMKITAPKHRGDGASAEPIDGKSRSVTVYRGDRSEQMRIAIVLCAAAVGERMREENHGTA
jgi:hypothetical protein